MAFFDDLSKKITDASTKTIQKGKDLTDVARLNSQISAEENRINTLYGMIGKQYMELHRKDAEDAFFLMNLVGPESIDDVYAIIERFMPAPRLTPLAGFFAQEIYSRYIASRASGPTVF